MPVVRRPAVAGQFYSGTKDGLRREIERCFTDPGGPGAPAEVSPEPLASPLLLMAPHAGYMYSGPVAAWGYREAAARGCPSLVVVLGTNHRGLTFADTIDVEGSWATPLGESLVAGETAREILARCPLLRVEPEGGRLEHSLEVQLPFVQFLWGTSVPIVPLMVSSHQMGTIERIGEAIAASVPVGTLLVASTDMTHFLSADKARDADAPALAAVERLDAAGLASAVARGGISMCGWAPTAAAIVAARALGVDRCRLLRYANSGDITHDRSSVVAYAAALADVSAGG
jgi:MEMO1 family protein